MRFRVLIRSPWFRSTATLGTLGVCGAAYLTLNKLSCEKQYKSQQDLQRIVELQKDEQVEAQITYSQVLGKVWHYVRSDWILFGTVLLISNRRL